VPPSANSTQRENPLRSHPASACSILKIPPQSSQFLRQQSKYAFAPTIARVLAHPRH